METSEIEKTSVAQSAGEEELVTCYCCGLTEECTPTYIATVKDRHQGRWICGLCAEAIKDENSKSQSGGLKEAMKRHVSFCEEFRMSTPPENPAEALISAMKQLLRRTLESPRKEGMGCHQALVRSKSCFAAVGEAQVE